jgi:hypothetical protein
MRERRIHSSDHLRFGNRATLHDRHRCRNERHAGRDARGDRRRPRCRQTSPEFRALREDQAVGGLTRMFKVFVHPEVNTRNFRFW